MSLDLRKLLRRDPSPKDLRALLEQGAEATGPLCAALTDDRFEDDARVRAARILQHLRDPAAVPAMLEALIATDPFDYLYSALVAALRDHDGVLEPALALSSERPEPEAQWAMAEALSNLGVRDERIPPVLLRVLEHNPGLGAAHIQEYGDPELMRPLHFAFGRLEPRADPQSAIGLAEAIEGLGGTLSPSQRAKLAEARERMGEILGNY